MHLKNTVFNNVMSVNTSYIAYGHCEPLSRKQVFIDLEEMMGGN